MQSFWRLLKYIQPYKKYVFLNVFCNMLVALFMVISIPTLIPFLQILFDKKPQEVPFATFNWSVTGVKDYLMYQFYHYSQTHEKSAVMLAVCLMIVLVFFFKNLFRYMAQYFIAPARYGIIRDLRKQLFQKVLSLPLSYFSEERKGDLMSRMLGDVQEVEWSILSVLETIFREPIVIAGSLFFMFYVSPSLTGFVFILLLVMGGIIGGLSNSLRRDSNESQERLGKIVSEIEEGIGGLRIIKGFNADKYQLHKFNRENDAYKSLLTRLVRRRDLASPMSEFLGIGVVAILLWYGSSLVFSEKMSAETFFAFLFAFYNVIDPAKSFSNAYYNVQKGIAAVNRIEHILDADLVIKDHANAVDIVAFKDKIEYKNVSFAYKETDKTVLKDINLSVQKGKIIALVGASGAGKSTLCDLLPRFYDVTEGVIVIDGVDIRNFTIKSLRDLIGIVSQEAILFNDTIYNNIVFGMENVTPEQVEYAAKMANAHDFIMDSENAYQTNIGDRGGKLSGGQRQRLTIARAILKNPPILILDEATSALDSQSEQIVQAALTKLMQDRTAFVIAHRLSTIQNADEILVMKDGKIIERGSHEVLLTDKNSEYHKLVTFQSL